MTPPMAPETDSAADRSAPPPAVSRCVPLVIETLRNRPDFLKAAQGRRQGTAGFLLQGRLRADDTETVRVGFTASKKIGNAVLRNRAKRRLRAIARDVLPRCATPGWDYVLVARPASTVARDFADLLSDFEAALAAIGRGRK